MSGFCFIREEFELKRTMLIILAILASMAIALKYFESNGPSTYASIFENIEELEQALSPYWVGQAPDDPALGTLGYTHAPQWIVAKDGYQYTVYGYTFTDQETEEQYRREIDSCYYVSMNMLGTSVEYLARYRTNALYIKGGRKTEDFLRWLDAYLPIKADDMHYDGMEDIRELL